MNVPRCVSIVPALVVELPVFVVDRIDRFELDNVEAFDSLLVSFRGGKLGCDALRPGSGGGAFLAGMVFAMISRSTGGGGR